MVVKTTVANTTCSFRPPCEKDFDFTQGARVTTIIDDKIVAYCHTHARELIARGVNLRPLEETRQRWLRMRPTTRSST